MLTHGCMPSAHVLVCRYHEAGLSASNQAASRLEGTSLQDMAHELARLRQEVRVQDGVQYGRGVL